MSGKCSLVQLLSNNFYNFLLSSGKLNPKSTSRASTESSLPAIPWDAGFVISFK